MLREVVKASMGVINNKLVCAKTVGRTLGSTNAISFLASVRAYLVLYCTQQEYVYHALH